MRHLLTLALVGSIVVVLSPAPAGSQNLLVNPNFDTDSNIFLHIGR